MDPLVRRPLVRARVPDAGQPEPELLPDPILREPLLAQPRDLAAQQPALIVREQRLEHRPVVVEHRAIVRVAIRVDRVERIRVAIRPAAGNMPLVHTDRLETTPLLPDVGPRLTDSPDRRGSEQLRPARQPVRGPSLGLVRLMLRVRDRRVSALQRPEDR
jgi:hypothetical protein